MKRKSILSGTVAIALAMGVFTACGNAEESKENEETTVESHEGGEEGKCGEGKCGEGKCGDGNESTETKCGEGKCGE